jgi:hypothetical protein
MQNEALGAFMSRAVDYGRMELARELGALDFEKDGRLARQVGSFYSVLMTGLIAQYLVDREHCPGAADLAEGLRYIAERLRAA